MVQLKLASVHVISPFYVLGTCSLKNCFHLFQFIELVHLMSDYSIETV